MELYTIALDTGAAVSEQLYSGYTVRPHAFREEYRSIAAAARRRPPVGRAVIPVPEAGVILLAYPNDRRLRPVAGPELRNWVAGALAAIPGLDGHTRWKARDVSATLLRYVPERRLTLRCGGEAVAADGTRRPFAAIVKQFRSGRRAAGVYAALAGLWRDGAPPVRLPRPLALDRDRGLVMMEALPGRELKPALAEFDAVAVMREVGGLLARFHGLPVRLRLRAHPRNELREVRLACRLVAGAVTGVDARLRDCFARLRAAQPSFPACPVLLHGAFRLKHIFLSEDRLAVLDLDGMCVGDPAYDIANFLSSLCYLEEQERFARGCSQQYAAAFLHGYAANARYRVSPATTLWYFATQVLHKQAAKYVRHRHADGGEKAPRMIARAEAALAVSRAGACRDLPDAALALQ
jgi:aminoglycoside phosphotransferase (APT) family kinase protein